MPPEEAEVPIDAEMLKVLASDTRLEVLKTLRQRRMTVTELATLLDLNKATVFEHLARLTKSGLVRRVEDPERLWVYYELTRRGGSVINPGRTRFLLVLGTGVLAAIVGIALLLALTAPQTPEPSSSADVLDVRLDQSSFLAGEPLRFRADVEGERGPLAAFLVRASDAPAIGRGGQVLGTPLQARDEGGVLIFEAPASVPAGAYLLFVQDASGRDNLGAMPAVQVEALATSVEPATWWRGLDGAARVRVARAEQPLSGTLVVARADGAPVLAAQLRNGTATLAPEGLDGLAPSTYTLRLFPQGGRAEVLLNATLAIREPQVAVTPTAVLEGAPAPLRLRILGGHGTPAVRVEGQNVAPMASGSEWLIPLGARDPGSLAVEVGRLARREVEVLPDLRPGLAVLSNTTWELDVRDRAGLAAPGIAAFLDGAPLGITNNSGLVAFPTPASGERRLSMLTPAGAAVERSILIQGGTAREAPSRLTLDASSQGAPEGRAVVLAALRNDGAARERLSLAVLLEGQLADARALTIAPGANASTLVELSVPRAGSHAVEVRAERVEGAPLRFVNRTSPPPSPAPAAPPGAPSPGSTGGSPASNTTTSGASDLSSDRITVVATDALQVSVRGFTETTADGLALQNEPVQSRFQLERKTSAAATPGPDALLIAAAVMLVAVAARRRRGP